VKKIFFALLAGAYLLTACGETQPEQATEGLKPEDITLPDTYDAALAEATNKRSCAGCHGVDLQGAGAYPQPITGLTKEEVYIAIVEGVGRMPANMVTGEEAENLAVWIAAQ
jgi:cytochrome c551